MGQHCSILTCRHVEHPDGMAEMSRLDSPDPVMYDLMRKSIQATSAMQQQTDTLDRQPPQETTQSNKSGKQARRPVGQAHLLYRNNSKTSSSPDVLTVSSPGTKPLSASRAEKKLEKRAMESRGGGGGKVTTNNKDNNNSGEMEGHSSWDVGSEESCEPTPSTLKCPTRLLIRRRSLRIIEEGGGTHIYAIRYPEDTSKMILSEQTQPQSPVVRQEQCPPRNSNKSAAAATVAVSNPSLVALTNQASNKSSDHDVKSKKKAEPGNTDGASPSKNKSKRADGNQISTSKASNDLPTNSSTSEIPAFLTKPENAGEIFSPACMMTSPKRNVVEWVTVSEEHNIYVADVGLSAEECDELVATTEQVCRGQYAAYTYAKQTLGCREFPVLAHASFHPVHTIVHSIIDKFPLEEDKSVGDEAGSKTTTKGTSPAKNTSKTNDRDSSTKGVSNDIKKDVSCSQSEEGVEVQRQLQLDDREPHIVKYDVTRKERQKLDMHTDKSEWTFLIALSNGCGVDYEGGGTYFECLDATVHIQRGHALVFPGKLRHCGQKITSGLRFLLVGFLVDKQSATTPSGKISTAASAKSPTKTTQNPDTSQKSASSIAKDDAQNGIAAF